MKAWEQFLTHQEKEIGVETVSKWLRPLKVDHFDACNLYLEAKDSFAVEWFEEHVRSKVQTQLLNNNKKRIKVHITCPTPTLKTKGKGKKNGESTVSSPPFSLSFDPIDPLCTFETFVTCEKQALACKLLSRTAGLDAPPELGVFNPIYLHGGAGTGKTHLLMAVAQALRAHGLQVLYTRAETFTAHVVTAIRAGEMSIFRQAYRTHDVLIFDDVQVLARKSATQEELFHTFNTLHLSGKQILLSASCPPSELEMIEPRLVSRFEWGIVLPLENLNSEEIRHLFTAKMEALRFPLHESVVNYFLETFATPKALMRALQAFILRIHLNSETEALPPQRLKLSHVKFLLSDLIEDEERFALTFEKIVQAVAEHFAIRTEDLLGKSQTRDCVLPRQLAMYFCRLNLLMPFLKIGERFGRDHSTVMSSVKLIQKGLDEDVRDIVLSYQTILKKMMSRDYQ